MKALTHNYHGVPWILDMLGQLLHEDQHVVLVGRASNMRHYVVEVLADCSCKMTLSMNTPIKCSETNRGKAIRKTERSSIKMGSSLTMQLGQLVDLIMIDVPNQRMPVRASKMLRSQKR